MKYKYIIWDWNGTLFDDIEISIIAMNNMLRTKGYDITIDYDTYRQIFCFPVIEYYIKAGFDLSRHSFDELAELYVEEYSSMHDDCKLAQGALQALEALKNANIRQAVISVCEKDRLAYQVGRFGIENYFDAVLGTDDNYAISKIDIAKKYLSENNIDLSQVLFIGDTSHDYEVACAVGCDCILVASGHQSEEILKQTGAVIADNIEHINDYII